MWTSFHFIAEYFLLDYEHKQVLPNKNHSESRAEHFCYLKSRMTCVIAKVDKCVVSRKTCVRKVQIVNIFLNVINSFIRKSLVL